MLKEEIRIVGFDDGPFSKKDKKIIVIGTIFRGGKFLDGLLKTEVTIDGLDSTEKIANIVNSSRHKNQLKVAMFDGITFGGFNLLDIKKFYSETNLPGIVINRQHPNLLDVKKALKNFKDFEKRWKIVENAGKIKEFSLQGKKIFYQNVGIEDEEAEEIIRLSCTRAFYPEPLRIAHIIATGIIKGESYGKA